MNMIVRYAIYAAIGYSLLVLVVYILQRGLIYFPDRQKPSSQTLAALGLDFWPQAAGYRGLIRTKAPQPTKGTIIVFHGNAGSAWHRGYFSEALGPMGYRVILAEYPGYGDRPGTLGEKPFLDDALATISEARAEFGDPIYLLGESMGCAIAAAAAHTAPDPIAGLVLVTPWDSLANLAQTHYWYLPARWLIKDRFDSAARLKSFKGPVAIVMAKEDQVIPNKHTMALYDALEAPKRLWELHGAGHNDWPSQPGAPWWKETIDFITTTGP